MRSTSPSRDIKSQGNQHTKGVSSFNGIVAIPHPLSVKAVISQIVFALNFYAILLDMIISLLMFFGFI